MSNSIGLQDQVGQSWLIHVDVWQKSTQYCKAIILQLKINSEKKIGQSLRKSPRIFIGRTDADAKAPILWPPDAKSLLIGKDFDPGKD